MKELIDGFKSRLNPAEERGKYQSEDGYKKNNPE